MAITMPKDSNKITETATQHTAPNESGIPRTDDERREARRAFMRAHRKAYEALANC